MLKSIARVAAIALLSSQLACFPVLANSGILTEWKPTIDRNQIVYVDSTLKNHSTSPVLFGPQLESKIAKIQSESNLRFYIIIKETNLPSNQLIGNVEIDNIFANWNGLPEFDSNRYAMIVWSRRADNPAKGNIAVNLNKQFSEMDFSGITKKYMPADPNGAILAIVQAIVRQKNFDNNFAIFALSVFSGLILWFVATLLIMVIDPHFVHRKEAKKVLNKWSQKIEDHTNKFLVVDKYDEIISWLRLQAKDSEYGQNLREAIVEYDVAVSSYNYLLEKVKSIFGKMNEFYQKGLYKDVISYENTPYTLNDQEADLFSSRSVFFDTLLSYLDVLSTSILCFHIRVDKIKTSHDPSQSYQKEYCGANDISSVVPKPAPFTVQSFTRIPTRNRVDSTTMIVISSNNDSTNYSRGSSSSSDYGSSSSDYGSSSSDYGSSSSDYGSSSSDYSSSSSDY